MEGETLSFALVDVFGAGPYGGNALPVVFDENRLTNHQMLRIAQEFRQFETIFVTRAVEPGRWHCKIFDLLEELPMRAIQSLVQPRLFVTAK